MVVDCQATMSGSIEIESRMWSVELFSQTPSLQLVLLNVPNALKQGLCSIPPPSQNATRQTVCPVLYIKPTQT